MKLIQKPCGCARSEDGAIGRTCDGHKGAWLRRFIEANGPDTPARETPKWEEFSKLFDTPEQAVLREMEAVPGIH